MVVVKIILATVAFIGVMVVLGVLAQGVCIIGSTYDEITSEGEDD